MANKRQRKKRLKKLAQMKVVKQTTIVPLTFREIEDMRVKEQTDLHNANENAKLERTAKYQEELNKKYDGFVTVKEKFINPRATLIHHCSNCNKQWYARPQWLLTKETQKHICGVDPVRIGSKGEKAVRIITDKDIAKMCMLAKQGMSNSKIAIEIGVSRPTVIKYLKKAKESKVLI
ncbi:hypothetical protein EXW38_28495 (plasmid) [Bacillus mycoides]|uniref:helix-turn-helix domain-containing protein n=1 Tax=Bacillus mycoides TaxID=1405 RepID=UPI001C02CCDB|nr:helix-turn-helix domain-containing protein [Bacillus mycoides]QWH15204.1 hypothetical protein EXW38_28495 [Bacillus mycoides]